MIKNVEQIKEAISDLKMLPEFSQEVYGRGYDFEASLSFTKSWTQSKKKVVFTFSYHPCANGVSIKTDVNGKFTGMIIAKSKKRIYDYCSKIVEEKL